MESGWNDSAIKAVFMKGLSGEIKDELVVRDDPPSLNKLTNPAIRLDNRMRERLRIRADRPTPSPPSLPVMLRLHLRHPHPHFPCPSLDLVP